MKPHIHEVGTRAELAALLTALRQESGLSVREVAARMAIPVATVGGYFSGRHLPPGTRGEILEDLLDTLGVAFEEQAEWSRVIARLRRRSANGRPGHDPDS